MTNEEAREAKKWYKEWLNNPYASNIDKMDFKDKTHTWFYRGISSVIEHPEFFIHYIPSDKLEEELKKRNNKELEK